MIDRDGLDFEFGGIKLVEGYLIFTGAGPAAGSAVALGTIPTEAVYANSALAGLGSLAALGSLGALGIGGFSVGAAPAISLGSAAAQGAAAGSPAGPWGAAAGAVVAVLVVGTVLIVGGQVLRQSGGGATGSTPRVGDVLEDPDSVEGMDADELEEAIRQDLPEGWRETEPRAPSHPKDRKFTNDKGQQIIIERGRPGATGVHGGPYARISRGGGHPVVRVPLKGNPEAP